MTTPAHDVFVWRAEQVGVAVVHSTLCPLQQQPPLPQLLVATAFSPGRHFPSQNGAVPRQVSACPNAAARMMKAPTAALANHFFVLIALAIMSISFVC